MSRAWRVELVPIDRLRGHEEVVPSKVRALAASIARDMVVRRPILVDVKYFRGAGWAT